MPTHAITARGLGKRFTVAASGRYQTFRDALTSVAASPFRQVKRAIRGQPGTRSPSHETLWALRDVSFDVAPGEVLGVIGRNGAGKSTLLKILSRITSPSEGEAAIHGRVGSLLEVGTGFHPELSGRDNIYLNGAILGMRRREIARMFDDIVAFAETERFVDTAVKHYSSGMQMRLAFAVAAHLPAEVLLVDEVLAVGDAAFQRRCLGKMDEIAHAGRTVLFVSHHLEAVQRLCTRCLLLERGGIVENGPSAAVVTHYLSTVATRVRAQEWLDLRTADRFGSGLARIEAVRFGGDDPALGYQPYSRGPFEVACLVRATRECEVGGFAATISSQLGSRLINADLEAIDATLRLPPGLSEIRLTIDALHLNPGVFRLGLWLADLSNGRYSEGIYDYIESACEFEVYGGETDLKRVDAEAVVTADFRVSAPVPAEWPLG